MTNRGILMAVPLALSLSMAATPALAGTIEGTVTVRGLRVVNAVVYIDEIPGKTFPAPQKHAVVDQLGLLFIPHFQGILKGTTVDFLNSDDVEHNVFWPDISGDKSKGLNLGTWKKGGVRSFKFDVTGVVPLLCNIHPEMAAFLVVSPTPYYASTDVKTGKYRIEDVPDGSYTVSAWAEGARRIGSQPVKVTGKAVADFKLRR